MRKKLEWDEIYQLAQSYYKCYGNLEIPQNFETINGYERIKKKDKEQMPLEQKNEITSLGRWIIWQRYTLLHYINFLQQKRNLSQTEKKRLHVYQERYKKLLEIGMIWDKKINAEYNIKILQEYGIDHKEHEYLIHIPNQELNSKIQYLLSNNIPILINGRPNEILFMSDVNMQEKYNVSRKDLIDTYYIDQDKKKTL